MYFVQKLKNFRLNSNLLCLLYQSVVPSTFLYSQVCYYSNTRTADSKTLDHSTTADRKITRHDIQSPTDICELITVLSDGTVLIFSIQHCAPRHTSTKQFISINWPRAGWTVLRTLLPTVIRLFSATARWWVTRQLCQPLCTVGQWCSVCHCAGSGHVTHVYQFCLLSLLHMYVCVLLLVKWLIYDERS